MNFCLLFNARSSSDVTMLCSCFGQMLRLHDTQRRCFSMETFPQSFFFPFVFYWKFHSSGMLSSLLFLSIIFTFLIIHFNSVRITSNEVIALESCHLCLLSSYFIFKDLFSTGFCTSYLSRNPVNTIVKKINYVHSVYSIFFFSKNHVIVSSCIFFNPHPQLGRINQSSMHMLLFSFCVTPFSIVLPVV